MSRLAGRHSIASTTGAGGFGSSEHGLALAQSQASLAQSESELQNMLVNVQHLRNRVNQTKSQRNILKHKLQRNQEMQGLLREEKGNKVEMVTKLEDSIQQHQVRVQEGHQSNVDDQTAIVEETFLKENFSRTPRDANF